MTITVELGDLEEVVTGLVRAGRYGSESEMLRMAVKLVQEREAARTGLLAKLDEGIADIEAGRTIPLEEVRAEMKARFGSIED